MDRTEAFTTRPCWPLPSGDETFSPLGEDVSVDVCIVGAGIAGLSTAYLLACEGASVVVLEASDLGRGETGRTTAHLASVQDDGFTELEDVFGRKGARLAAQSHAAAIGRIEQIVQEENLDCDFQRMDGYLFNPPGSSDRLLEKEYKAAKRAGMEVAWLNRGPLPLLGSGPWLKFARQGQIHPTHYLAGLAGAVHRRGGRIFVLSPVIEIEGGKRPRALTRHGPVVRAKSLVIATNSPISERLEVHLKQEAYRTYVVALRFPRDVIPRALYWDTGDPYHYVRLQRLDGGEEMLIVGGEDHKTGEGDHEEKRWTALEAWARVFFPAAGALQDRWSGQVLEPADGMAYIGPEPGEDNVYIVTGNSGQGMTHGTIAGMLLTDQIVGRHNPWAELYDPSRVRLGAVGDYVHMGVDIASRYAEWVMPSENRSEVNLKPGEGAIEQVGLMKVAVCVDRQGKEHRHSAVCPHLGCVVAWNAAEQSWDCPCHGSRFDAAGKVLNGPAAEDLAPADE